ncbi:uncharacterized protein SOCE836_085510 [Sorangium cellulosum]|uniref:Uncharacterized protein n=1 Tax=Sorangium cellulosum TaxID=56 RepID=A0A4P2R0A0_SORCE|nr:uncharacterized protein SOCE836_085510 [Sorangium cellulosum]WCQ95643.1 hypothetical protein NQZ70_08420 [Sorangium sp. Soce836]
MPSPCPEGPRRALGIAHLRDHGSPGMTEAPRGRNGRWPSGDPARPEAGPGRGPMWTRASGGDPARIPSSRARARRQAHVRRASVVVNMVFEKSENAHSRALVEELNQLK